jgi:plasmid stabilization system protein ParE
MKKKIIWSDEAKADYTSNVDYLLQEWSIQDAQEFVDNVNDIISVLDQMPDMFPLSNYQKVRKGVVCKQISILYQVHQTEIHILRFWDNRKNPKKLKL